MASLSAVAASAVGHAGQLLAAAGGSGSGGGTPGMDMPGMTGVHRHMFGMTMAPDAPPTTWRIAAWQPNWWFIGICTVLLVGYGWAWIRLERRGSHWPVIRGIWWLVGVASILAVTCTGIGSYGMALFTVHMVQHMSLTMLTPIPMLLAAPITLALRALPGGHDGRKGPRQYLAAFLHHPVVAALASPFFAIPLFILTLYGMYFTPVFDWAMSNTPGHLWMLLHFLATGLLFFWPIIGLDPAPRKQSYPARLLIVFLPMPFHVFFGIALMMSTTVITKTFAHPPVAWGISALADQQTAGAVAWSFAEVPNFFVLVAMLVLWVRSDRRLALRRERAIARAGRDVELDDYNAYLARLATEDGEPTPAVDWAPVPRPTGPLPGSPGG